MTPHDPLDRLLDDVRVASRPRPDELVRVRDRLLAHLEDARAEADAEAEVRAVLSAVRTTSPERTGALHRRLLVRARRQAWGRIVFRTVLVAALVFVAVRTALPPPPPIDDTIALALLPEAPGHATPTSDVRVAWNGRGDVGGTSRAPRLTWQQGRLDVEVTPGAGIDLTVDTREAHVAVVGTGFSVHRDALGTRVDVRHGRVAVQCVDGPSKRLDVGDTLMCPPIDAVGQLGRVRRMRELGTTPDQQLQEVERGLALGGPDIVRGELIALRVAILADLGRVSDARAAAQQYLDEGHRPRSAEIAEALRTEMSDDHP